MGGRPCSALSLHGGAGADFGAKFLEEGVVGYDGRARPQPELDQRPEPLDVRAAPDQIAHIPAGAAARASPGIDERLEGHSAATLSSSHFFR